MQPKQTKDALFFYFYNNANKFPQIRVCVSHVASPQDVTGSEQKCHIDFVFDYICAFPLCCSKFYQQARALSDYPTAMIQHACHILFPRTCHGKQSDAVPPNIYSASCPLAHAVDFLFFFYCFRDFISFVRRVRWERLWGCSGDLGYVCFIMEMHLRIIFGQTKTGKYGRLKTRSAVVNKFTLPINPGFL